ncbi:MAG: hypothetical protein LBH07_02095 [Treponema sp.]|jgi:hypothetical protein|nr:hypothetical protein [Treponema sp.]
MKKLCFVLVIVFLVIGTVTAQGRGNPRGAYTQTITVEGTLQLQNGHIAVSTGNMVYFVPSLERYIGFIESLKEGARITIMGNVSGNILQPVQMTINGKTYDLLANNYGGYGTWCGCGYCYGPAGSGAGRGGWGRRGW